MKLSYSATSRKRTRGGRMARDQRFAQKAQQDLALMPLENKALQKRIDRVVEKAHSYKHSAVGGQIDLIRDHRFVLSRHAVKIG